MPCILCLKKSDFISHVAHYWWAASMFRIDDQKPPIIFENNWGEREEYLISHFFLNCSSYSSNTSTCM